MASLLHSRMSPGRYRTQLDSQVRGRRPSGKVDGRVELDRRDWFRVRACCDGNVRRWFTTHTHFIDGAIAKLRFSRFSDGAFKDADEICSFFPAVLRWREAAGSTIQVERGARRQIKNRASILVAFHAELPNRSADCRLPRRPWHTRIRNHRRRPSSTGHCLQHRYSLTRTDWRKWGD